MVQGDQEVDQIPGITATHHTIDLQKSPLHYGNAYKFQIVASNQYTETKSSFEEHLIGKILI